jgi:hypothetical protein
MAKRFRFVSPGEVLVGVVRGNNDNPIQRWEKLIEDQARAVSGVSLSPCFEPKPGHIAVYCEYQDGSNPGQVEMIDLRNPELKILELVEGGEPVLKIGEIVFKDVEPELALAA